MILSFINIRKVPREMLKTSGFALGFQHLPRDLANINEWKITFDLYINILQGRYHNMQGNTCPTVIPRICVRVKQVLIG